MKNNLMKNIIFFSICVLFSIKMNAQEIKWVSFEKAIALNKETPKKILIDVYTDWCGYCKKMDKTTYENQIIVSLINEKFYPVKLDAEQKETILYNEKEYKFIKNGRRGYNEFAANILHGEMSYPSTVFMDNDESLIDKIPGYLSPEIMELILVFLGEEIYLEQSWEEFQKEFISNL